MNTLQYFHKERSPIFNIGDKVKLKKYPEDVRNLYNKYYPSCFLNENDFKKAWDNIAKELGYTDHIVSKVEEGTPAAGGWFIYVDNLSSGYHGNIFELIKL